MALAEYRHGVNALREIFLERLSGRITPAWACGCGAVHQGEARFISLDPEPHNYPGSELDPSSWTASFVDEHGVGSSQSITMLFPKAEVLALFDQYLPSLDRHRWLNDDELRQQYRPRVQDADRIKRRLVPAVSIEQWPDGEQLSLYFHWGTAQEAAKAILDLTYGSRDQPPPTGQVAVTQAVAILGQLRPEVFVGGAIDPEYDWESRWLTDYQGVLALAATATRFSSFSHSGLPNCPPGAVNSTVVFVHEKSTVD